MCNKLDGILSFGRSLIFHMCDAVLGEVFVVQYYKKNQVF
jgi:hypothetical protein